MPVKLKWNNAIDSELIRRFEEMEEKRREMRNRLKSVIPDFDNDKMSDIE